MREKHKRVSRRRLLKTAGLGAAAAADLAASALAQVPRNDTAPFDRRPWWVQTVDRPALGETNAEFQRFAGPNIFGLYRQLKDERDGAGASQAQQEAKRARIGKWIRERKLDFGLRDRQLLEAAWTVNRSARTGTGLLSWTRLRTPAPEELGVEPYAASPQEAASTVKAAARLFGAALVGIAPMNENYINRKEDGKDIVFEDVDVPAVTEKKYVIPKKMKWVVAIAIQMDLDLIARSPTALGNAADSLGYSQCAFTVATLAEFIRGLGYQAIPSVNDTAQSVPFAVDAGLGELGRLNRLVTPEYGPAVRLCKVFTDLPMAYDKPIDFGLPEFCTRCKRCALACPADALSFAEEPSYKVRGPWNNPGHKAWFEDAYRCFQYWQEVTTGCGICLAACPWTQNAHTWAYKVIRATPPWPMPPLYSVAAGPFGYLTQPEADDWWDRDLPPLGIDQRRRGGR